MFVVVCFSGTYGNGLGCFINCSLLVNVWNFGPAGRQPASIHHRQSVEFWEGGRILNLPHKLLVTWKIA